MKGVEVGDAEVEFEAGGETDMEDIEDADNSGISA